MSDKEPTEEEKAKAERTIKWIYAAMAFFILLPFIIILIKKN